MLSRHSELIGLARGDRAQDRATRVSSRAIFAARRRPRLAGAPRRLGQRVEREVGAFAAQPEVAERAFGDAGRQLEAIDQVGRSEHAIAGLPAEILDAGRGVDGVAEENDLLLHRSHLAGHHRTAMQPGAEIDRRRRIRGDSRARVPRAGRWRRNRPRRSAPERFPPRASRSRSVRRRRRYGFRRAPRRSAR